MKADRNFFVSKLVQVPAQWPVGNLKPASVLVPVVDRPEATLLFTLRTDHLPTHAGQVSFPGGRMHADDASPLATALRETNEEIGVAQDHIDIVGFLDPYNTGTGYSVTPVVGLVHPDHRLMPNTGEVAEVFEVPLQYLLDRSNLARKKRTLANGMTFENWEIAFGRHVIWGATAQILVAFLERLR